MATAAAQSKPKKTASSKKPPSHPTFFEMITDAISSLKERTGSSQYAITKFIEEKHKNLPPTFRKLLLHNLKKSVAAGKLVKVKNSFKLAPKASSAPAKAPSASAAAKPKASSKAGAKAATKPKSKPAASAAPKKKAAAKPKAKAATGTAKAKKPAVKKVAAAKSVKKTPVKKPKSVKSPAKKAPAKKAKK